MEHIQTNCSVGSVYYSAVTKALSRNFDRNILIIRCKFDVSSIFRAKIDENRQNSMLFLLINVSNKRVTEATKSIV